MHVFLYDTILKHYRVNGSKVLYIMYAIYAAYICVIRYYVVDSNDLRLAETKVDLWRYAGDWYREMPLRISTMG